MSENSTRLKILRNRTHFLEPLEFDANTASRDEIAHNKSIKETALKFY